MSSQRTFDHAVHEALENSQLRSNFRGAMDFLQQKRRAVFDDDQELAALKKQAHAIKQNALHKLPDLLEQLEQNLTKNGIQVHWAETTEEACQKIYQVIEDNQGQRVVKGKSMVSEEIGLNHFLEERGVECLESDMGEYIVQLAKETPSHIIMPAIHKSKEEIARLFERQIPSAQYTEEVDELIGTGRRVLRQKFEEADIGLSGVNFAVAESGTLCLVENEGNGRMCTTIPKVHIAVTGIEKVIEHLSDLPPLLSLLTRSATGQRITTYINMISRPRQPDETDGPEAVHLVLVDNGRSRMYQHEALQETLRCIRCGSCMNHCPVYTRIGGHAYGTVYPGPIGQVVAPQMLGLDNKGDITEACSLNGACGEVCPVEIPLPELIRTLREEKQRPKNDIRDRRHTHPPGAGSARTRSQSLIWRLWKQLYSSPRLYRLFSHLVNRLRVLTPTRLGAWTRYRTAPKPASENLHQLMQRRARNTAEGDRR